MRTWQFSSHDSGGIAPPRPVPPLGPEPGAPPGPLPAPPPTERRAAARRQAAQAAQAV